MPYFKYVISTLLLLFCMCIYGQKCDNGDIEHHLGTKTPYRVVANKNHSVLNYKGCEATKAWLLVRHGTRNPNAKLIEKFNTRLPEIRDLILEKNKTPTEILLSSILEAFRKWQNEVDVSDAKKLTIEGRREMVDLAERMQARFPNVFPNIYSNTSYEFKFTHTQRTKKSARYFTIGLFGKQIVNDIWFPEPLKKDPVLRFYKLCNKWRTEVSKNPRSLKERQAFDSSSYMTKVVEKVNKNLNLQNELNFVDVHAMYTTCAFETAWNKKRRSPWCAPFDDETISIMEYSEDLKYYWVDGYGYELTYKQACPAFKDMLEHIESKNKYPLATVYFTHSGTLLKMIAHLGLYKNGEPLLSTNYKDVGSKRLWRVSNIDAFGTNLAFVNYNCGSTAKLLVLHQEKIVRLPSCPDSDLCELSNVKKYYSDSINNCNFNEMCGL